MIGIKEHGENVGIRPATSVDLSALTDIYNHYVRESNISFDEKPGSSAEREKWMRNYDVRGPYRLLVAEQHSRLLGCAFSSVYRQHPAFRQTVETSIYLHPDARGQSLGTALYSALFEILEQEDIHRVVVGIALPNPASVALHERFGFRTVGVFNEYAIKNGQRISSVWMEKALDGAW
jgi:phosphinothricin acetyltransferase